MDVLRAFRARPVERAARAVLPAGATRLADDRSPFVPARPPASELCGYLFAVSGCVFVVQLAEFSLVRLTSALTVAIFASARELLTIVGAVLVLHDELTLLNMLGVLLATAGTGVYHATKGHSKAAPDRPAEDDAAGAAPPSRAAVEV